MPFTVIIAEDHLAFRQLVRAELENIAGIAVVGEAADGHQLLGLVQEVRPDLIILDISMPKLGGLEAARIIKERHGQVKILFLTMHRNPAYVQQARRLGAEGYLLKEELDQALDTAIKSIRCGETYISQKVCSG